MYLYLKKRVFMNKYISKTNKISQLRKNIFYLSEINKWFFILSFVTTILYAY